MIHGFVWHRIYEVLTVLRTRLWRHSRSDGSDRHSHIPGPPETTQGGTAEAERDGKKCALVNFKR